MVRGVISRCLIGLATKRLGATKLIGITAVADGAIDDSRELAQLPVRVNDHDAVEPGVERVVRERGPAEGLEVDGDARDGVHRPEQDVARNGCAGPIHRAHPERRRREPLECVVTDSATPERQLGRSCN